MYAKFNNSKRFMIIIIFIGFHFFPILFVDGQLACVRGAVCLYIIPTFEKSRNK